MQNGAVGRDEDLTKGAYINGPVGLPESACRAVVGQTLLHLSRAGR